MHAHSRHVHCMHAHTVRVHAVHAHAAHAHAAHAHAAKLTDNIKRAKCQSGAGNAVNNSNILAAAIVIKLFFCALTTVHHFS